MGIILFSLGIGLILGIVIPIWGYILVVGIGLIYVGWCLINSFHK
mgnify:CR=1 FL=1